MSLTSHQLAELEILCSDLAEERLSAEGRLALEDLLQSEPEARDHYIRFMALCSDLHEFGATSLSVGHEDELHVVASLRDADAGLARDRPTWMRLCETRFRLRSERPTVAGVDGSGHSRPGRRASGDMVAAAS